MTSSYSDLMSGLVENESGAVFIQSAVSRESDNDRLSGSGNSNGTGVLIGLFEKSKTTPGGFPAHRID